MNSRTLEKKNKVNFLNTFIFFSSFIAALPSFLIYLCNLLSKGLTVFSRDNIIFNEKFWIYLLEFKRNSLNGFLSWPSSNLDFNNIIYLERIFPRLLYYPIINNIDAYFLYDAVLIFIAMIICQLIIIKILSAENIEKISVPIVLGLLSIYNLKIIFLEKDIFESWFSRNPVAIISLTFFISIYFSSRYLINRKNCILYTIIFVLFSLTHTYSYLLGVSYYLLVIFLKSLIKKDFEIHKFFLPIPSLIIFIIYYVSLNDSESFSLFRDYYGLVNSYIPNINEIIKLFFLFIISILFIPKSKRFQFYILIISTLVLTNLHVLTGQSIKDIHYRLYSIEWLCSFYIVSSVIKYFFSNFNGKIINFIFIGLFLFYLLNYTYNFKYSSLEMALTKKCNLSLPMTGAILNMNKVESLNCNIFIWDAPPFENTKKLVDQWENSDIKSKAWMEAIAHLHPKLFK